MSFALRFITGGVMRCTELRRTLTGVLMLLSLSACSANTPQMRHNDVGVVAQHNANPPALGEAGAPAAQRTAAIGGGTTGVMVDLEDTMWHGGYRGANDGTYDGRTATWIYGAATEFSTIEATFVVEAHPFGTAELNVEGLDSVGSDKTPIAIAVNGHEIYNGLNQLPDDSPLAPKPWSSYSWTFNAQILQPGRNTVSITNLALGGVSEPPFLMLDYAHITYEEQ
jgi:hypothetical protein